MFNGDDEMMFPPAGERVISPVPPAVRVNAPVALRLVDAPVKSICVSETVRVVTVPPSATTNASSTSNPPSALMFAVAVMIPPSAMVKTGYCCLLQQRYLKHCLRYLELRLFQLRLL
jgi:hypothetical protein